MHVLIYSMDQVACDTDIPRRGQLLFYSDFRPPKTLIVLHSNQEQSSLYTFIMS